MSAALPSFHLGEPAVPDWSRAGISQGLVSDALVRAKASLRVCDSTPSFIEDAAGEIVGQVTERMGGLLDSKERTAEMWARTLCLAAGPDMLAALQAEQEWRDREAAGELDPDWDYEEMVGSKRRAASGDREGHRPRL